MYFQRDLPFISESIASGTSSVSAMLWELYKTKSWLFLHFNVNGTEIGLPSLRFLGYVDVLQIRSMEHLMSVFSAKVVRVLVRISFAMLLTVNSPEMILFNI